MIPASYNQSTDEQDAGVIRKRRPPNLESKKMNVNTQEGCEVQPPSVPTNRGDLDASMCRMSHLNSLDLSRPAHGSKNPYRSPSSPAYTFCSSSPRMHSPASSQIFERSVQEDIIPTRASPSIPSHIVTENHIPPILEASLAAITDDRLDPDSVEIITHSIHQPAALTVTGIGACDQLLISSLHGDGGTHPVEYEDSASNYGTLDSADVRRLSFISFADVVHAEHAESGEQFYYRDHLHNVGYQNNSAAAAIRNRSPSPIRSPVSSLELGTSPPASSSPSFKAVESSPSRGGRHSGSPLFPPPTHSPLSGNFYSEFNIETMRQALKRTGSTDLSGARSQPPEAVVNDDGVHDVHDRGIK
jgi:hypothetical protein